MRYYSSTPFKLFKLTSSEIWTSPIYPQPLVPVASFQIGPCPLSFFFFFKHCGCRGVSPIIVAKAYRNRLNWVLLYNYLMYVYVINIYINSLAREWWYIFAALNLLIAKSCTIIIKLNAAHAIIIFVKSLLRLIFAKKGSLH